MHICLSFCWWIPFEQVGGCFTFLWPCVMSIVWRERTDKMQLILCLLSNFYLNMFRASLCPSSGEQDRVLLHIVFCTGCAGCGCVELCRKLCARRKPYAVIHGLVLLMMGIMMPETCWDRSLIINIGLSFCDRARVLYILKKTFALEYTLKHSLIKIN